MGGVNFTRNRAWWHTAIWDEYGQRHQYLCLIPTFAFMIPLYWYGSFINRELEQNYAAKMYQLDYENRRNRLTHNLIMEHFESHVEKVQDILDQVKAEGFEKAFEYEIKNPPNEFIQDSLPFQNEEYWAEFFEHTGLTQTIDDFIEHNNLPYWKRVEFEKHIIRRKTPYAPYKYLNQVGHFGGKDINHTYVDPYATSMLYTQGHPQIQASKDE